MDVRKRLTKDQVLTIPNAMSVLRLLLIPFIIWMYVEERYAISVGLVVLSAVSDMLDGLVARKLNMISDLGKFLDPVCDKLTHAALLVCLMTTHRHIYILFIILAVKELAMLGMGLALFRKRDVVYSAKWYGKLCTVVFEGTLMGLMLFPNANENTVHMLMLLCAAVLLFSFTMYSIFYLRHIFARGAKNSD